MEVMLGDQLDLWASHTSLPLSSVRSSVLARRRPPERSRALAAAGEPSPRPPVHHGYALCRSHSDSSIGVALRTLYFVGWDPNA